MNIPPPKLIRLGSGEIIQWTTTKYPKVPMSSPVIAEYRDAEIKEFAYIHKSDMETANAF